MQKIDEGSIGDQSAYHKTYKQRYQRTQVNKGCYLWPQYHHDAEPNFRTRNKRYGHQYGVRNHRNNNDAMYSKFVDWSDFEIKFFDNPLRKVIAEYDQADEQ